MITSYIVDFGNDIDKGVIMLIREHKGVYEVLKHYTLDRKDTVKITRKMMKKRIKNLMLDLENKKIRIPNEALQEVSK